MTGLPGLPALDRTLLPKPYTDLWPDLASETGGGGGGVISGTGLLGPHLGRAHPAWWRRGQPALHILWGGRMNLVL